MIDLAKQADGHAGWGTRWTAGRHPSGPRPAAAYGPAAALVLVSSLALPFLAGAPADAATVAAIFPPWWSASTALAAAAQATGPEGAIVGLGNLPFIIILRPAPGEGHAPLRRAGAFLVLDPNGFTGCAGK